jgi:hypothetical protein
MYSYPSLQTQVHAMLLWPAAGWMPSALSASHAASHLAAASTESCMTLQVCSFHSAGTDPSLYFRLGWQPATLSVDLAAVEGMLVF